MRKLILNVKVVTMELLKVEYSLYISIYSPRLPRPGGHSGLSLPVTSDRQRSLLVPPPHSAILLSGVAVVVVHWQDEANCHSKRICLFTSNLSRLQQSDLHQPTNDQRTKLCRGFQYVFPSYLPTPTQLYLYFDI